MDRCVGRRRRPALEPAGLLRGRAWSRTRCTSCARRPGTPSACSAATGPATGPGPRRRSPRWSTTSTTSPASRGTAPSCASPSGPPPTEGATEWIDYDPNWRQFLGTALAVAVTDFDLSRRPRRAGPRRRRPRRGRRAAGPGAADLRQHRPAARVAGGVGRARRRRLRRAPSSTRSGATAASASTAPPPTTGSTCWRSGCGSDADAPDALRRDGARDRGGPVDRHRPLVARRARQPVRPVLPGLRHGPRLLRRAGSSLALWCAGPARPDAVAGRPTSCPTATTCAWPRCSSTSACGCRPTARPAFERFHGARAVAPGHRGLAPPGGHRLARGRTSLVGGEAGDSGLQARGQFHPATVHWRQPDGADRLAPRRAPRPDPGPRRASAASSSSATPTPRAGPAGPVGHQRHARRGRRRPLALPGPRPSTSPPTHRSSIPATLRPTATRPRSPASSSDLTAGSPEQPVVRYAAGAPLGSTGDGPGRRADDHAARRAPALVLGARPARPFALAIVGAALFSLMAVGGTVVLGRVTDDVLAPGLRGGRRRAERRRRSAPSPSWRLGPPDGRRGAAPLLRPDGPAADAGAVVPAGHRPLPRRAAAVVRRAPHRRAARPRRRRLRALDDGDAAAPVLARRGAAHRRVDGAAGLRRPGAPRRRAWRCSPAWPCSTTPTRSASSSRPPPPRPASATCRAWPTRASRAPCS